MTVPDFLKRGASPGTLGWHMAAGGQVRAQQETNLSEGAWGCVRSTAVGNTAVGVLPEKNRPPCLFWEIPIPSPFPY